MIKNIFKLFLAWLRGENLRSNPRRIFTEKDQPPSLDEQSSCSNLICETNQPSSESAHKKSTLTQNMHQDFDSLFNEAWEYCKRQERLIECEKLEIQTLHQKLEHNKNSKTDNDKHSLYESEQPHRLHFQRHRNRLFQKKVSVYKIIYDLRKRKKAKLEDSLSNLSIALEELRFELMKQDAFLNSFDASYGLPEQYVFLLERKNFNKIQDFRNRLENCKQHNHRIVKEFNQELLSLEAEFEVRSNKSNNTMPYADI